MGVELKDALAKRKLRLAGARNGEVYIGPSKVQINITRRCNLRCRYCGYHGSLRMRQAQARRPQDISFAKFLELVQDCKSLNVDSICLSGEGEPTLHPRFSDMLKVLKEGAFDITVMTNGTFPEALCQDLVGVDRVHINLGAADRGLYKRLHGRDLFARVAANIRQLALLRRRHAPRLKIQVAFVVNRLNADVQGKLRVLARHLGADALLPYDMAVHGDNADIACQVEKGLARPGSGSVPCRPCFNGWFMAVVELGGRVGVCCRMLKENTVDIRRRRLHDVWHSQEFMRIRLAGRRGDFHRKFAQCRQCIYAKENAQTARVLSGCTVRRNK